MATEYLGSFGIGAIAIGVSIAIPGGLGFLAELQAQLAAALEVNLELTGPGIDFSAAIDAALSAGITLPGLAIDANFEIIAELEAQIALYLPLLALQAALAVGGAIHLYKHDGPVSMMGPDLAALTATGLPGGSGPAEQIYGVTIVATDPATWAALSLLLKVE